jgi:hypothetical protein
MDIHRRTGRFTMTTEDKFRNRDGSLTVYAFACGYLESWTLDGKDEYYGTDAPGVTLYRESPTWHVKVREPGVTVDSQGYPLWETDPETGARSRADWHTFDSLTEARKFKRATIARLRKAYASQGVAIA